MAVAPSATSTTSGRCEPLSPAASSTKFSRKRVADESITVTFLSARSSTPPISAATTTPSAPRLYDSSRMMCAGAPPQVGPSVAKASSVVVTRSSSPRPKAALAAAGSSLTTNFTSTPALSSSEPFTVLRPPAATKPGACAIQVVMPMRIGAVGLGGGVGDGAGDAVGCGDPPGMGSPVSTGGVAPACPAGGPGERPCGGIASTGVAASSSNQGNLDHERARAIAMPGI